MKFNLIATTIAMAIASVGNFIAPALAKPIWTVYSRDAEGRTGHLIQINIYPSHGININLIPTGMVVQKVWLDDINQIAVSFDGHLCNWDQQHSCDNSTGAQVIHLKLIKTLVFCAPTQQTIPAPVAPSVNGELPYSPPPQNYNNCDPQLHSGDGSTTLTLLAAGNGTKKLFIFKINPMPHGTPDDLVVVEISPQESQPLLPSLKYKPSEEISDRD
ncbi:MAG: hypothetical protein QNJ54_36980 [Prochloraceae cyanobacterium]|nr:hypothetical protein [Prochloraceae cyanobacterium]